MTSEAMGRIALVWRGDLETRRQATPANNRWRDIFAALAALNIDAEPAVYCEEAADGFCRKFRARDALAYARRQLVSGGGGC